MNNPSQPATNNLGNNIQPATGTDSNKTEKGDHLGNIVANHLTEEKKAGGGSDPDNAQNRRNLKKAGYTGL
ncbi:uncharacterized protein KY384_007906 [Bacidia gigantensis]|uniref:uncharacterized protein n=1 Tax=Bacidia gigantensis TaxID=2732470 RepID=UPI001D037DD9|nr:uncharacterized protein KY384_007906 [Bacidia gigantensis]KAG8527752.1 hypothetical protein KY384_007906 [Bacidia gigantensis]